MLEQRWLEAGKCAPSPGIGPQANTVAEQTPMDTELRVVGYRNDESELRSKRSVARRRRRDFLPDE